MALFWYAHNVMSAATSHMELTLTILHGLLGPLPGLPQEDRLLISQEMAERVQFSPAEPVD